MKLLLISNSTNPGEPYLSWPLPFIQEFIRRNALNKVLFVPYAGVNLSNESIDASYDVYEQRVSNVFGGFGCALESVHRTGDPVKAVEEAECVVIGGGNTFHLVAMMHRTGIMQAIGKRAETGMPYMGWSAGANVACPSLRTTNDMPIIMPESFDCLNLVPFQINPHYLDANPQGHGGETRQQRIEEFLAINRNITVVGLRESSLIEVDDLRLTLKGYRSMRLFRHQAVPQEIEQGTDVSWLMNRDELNV